MKDFLMLLCGSIVFMITSICFGKFWLFLAGLAAFLFSWTAASFADEAKNHKFYEFPFSSTSKHSKQPQKP